MTRYRHRRTSTPTTAFPSPIEPGEIAVNTANRQIAVGDADAAAIGAPLQLIAIRFHDPRANYAAGDLVVQSAKIYRAKAAIPPGAFNLAEWEEAGGSGGGGATGEFVPISGGIMTGPLTLSGPPMVDGHAANKLYIDQRIIVSDTPPATPADSTLWWCSTDGALYVRYNDGNGPAQWVIASPQPDFTVYALKTDVTAGDALKVAKAGDLMSGDLEIKKTSPVLVLNDQSTTGYPDIQFRRNSLNRWIARTTNETESGSNNGSNFELIGLNDAGAGITATPLKIARADGRITLAADPTAALGVATKQYVDARDMRRNRIVNPAMAISQENGFTVSPTVATLNYYAADQWVGQWTLTGSTANAQRQAGTVIEGGYNVILNTGAAITPAANDYAIIQTRIEGTRIRDFKWGSLAQAAVLRFECFTNSPGTYCVSIRNGASDRSYLTTFVAGNGVWQTYTLLIPGDTTPTWAGDNTLGMSISWVFVAGSSLVGVAGWQAGNKLAVAGMTNGIATASRAFIIRNVGLYLDDTTNSGVAPRWTAPDEIEELRLCQRYWEASALVMTNAGTQPSAYWMAEKRAAPTITSTFNAGTGAVMFPVSPSIGFATKAYFQNSYHSQVATATVVG